MGGKTALILALVLLGPALAVVSGRVSLSADWRTASRTAAGIAPDPARTRDAVVQVYAARAFGWRGLLGVHSWISVKPEGAAGYTTYEVIGWNALHGGRAVSRRAGPPDRRWFGAEPELLLDMRGAAAQALIPEIEAAVAAYPYRDTYRLWPGPNSNTFTAFVAREVAGLRLDLPPTAIGKDYLEAPFAARAPSGTGVQVSVYGLVGIIAAWEEGVEVSVLGLTFGIDLTRPALKLPGIGRIGVG